MSSIRAWTSHNRIQAHARAHDALDLPGLDAGLAADDLGLAALEFRRDVLLEHVGGFDDVIVDAHQNHIFKLHGMSSRRIVDEPSSLPIWPPSSTRMPMRINARPRDGPAQIRQGSIARPGRFAGKR
jgi:hypothetical protein